jgi:chromosome segregation ATPase
MLNERELLDLKKQIQQSKTKVSELQGTRDYLLKQLKKDWDCDSIKQAKAKIQGLQDSIEKLDLDIKKGIKEIESLIGQDKGDREPG